MYPKPMINYIEEQAKILCLEIRKINGVCVLFIFQKIRNKLQIRGILNFTKDEGFECPSLMNLFDFRVGLTMLT